MHYHSIYTYPSIGVAAVDSNVEGVGSGEGEPGETDNRDIGYGTCHYCGGRISVMRTGTLRPHGGRHHRCPGSGRPPIEDMPPCASCGRVLRIAAAGLCWSCYRHQGAAR